MWQLPYISICVSHTLLSNGNDDCAAAERERPVARLVLEGQAVANRLSNALAFEETYQLLPPALVELTRVVEFVREVRAILDECAEPVVSRAARKRGEIGGPDAGHLDAEMLRPAAHSEPHLLLRQLEE